MIDQLPYSYGSQQTSTRSLAYSIGLKTLSCQQAKKQTSYLWYLTVPGTTPFLPDDCASV